MCEGYSTDFSYRRGDKLDDSLVFSLDLPVANSPDCYRIDPEENSFILSEDKQRVCPGGPHLAIAVLSRDTRDVVAVLTRNGIIPRAIE